jgi:hypothetical protein
VTRQGDPAREFALGACFAALGVVLPILFHMIGVGRFLLPMHLPVLVAGLVLRPRMAALVGLVVPWMSSLLTGMPPMPMPVLMSAELAALASVGSLLTAASVPTWAAAIGAVAARCAATWVVTTTVGAYIGVPPQAAGWASVISGAPGIVLQLVVVPPLVLAIRRRGGARAPNERES